MAEQNEWVPLKKARIIAERCDVSISNQGLRYVGMNFGFCKPAPDGFHYLYNKIPLRNYLMLKKGTNLTHIYVMDLRKKYGKHIPKNLSKPQSVKLLNKLNIFPYKVYGRRVIKVEQALELNDYFLEKGEFRE